MELLEKNVSRSSKAHLLQNVLKFFTILWLVTGIGVVLGQFVPIGLIIPLIFVELGLLIAVIFTRKAKKANQLLALAFAAVSGIVLYPVMNMYVGELGSSVVLTVFLAATAIFSAFGLFGYRLNTNLGGWGSYLFIILVAVVIFMLIGIFFPLGNTLWLIISFVSVILFSLYTVYDFNQIRHQNFHEEDVPLLAINLYLNLLNIVLSVLRILGISFGD